MGQSTDPPVLAVCYWLFFRYCPALTVLSWQSRPGSLVRASVLVILFWQLCSVCPIHAVLSCLSCPGCPVLLWNEE
jgi:hypothetical protein